MEHLPVDDREGARWITLHGDLGQQEVLKLKERFDEAVDTADTDVVVDLSGVLFLGTFGIGLILTARDRLHKRGHGIKLKSVPGFVEDVFKSMSIHDCFEWV